MKKLSIFMAASAMLALASCEDAKTPVLNSGLQDKVDAFTLNTPPYADQTINLGEEGTIALSVFQQPEYGFPGEVSYTLYAALNPADLNPATIQEGVKVLPVPAASTPTDRNIIINQSALATVMCSLNGMFDDNTWNPDLAANGQKLYLICGASIANTPATVCYSNTVAINNVTFYKAFKTPKRIWIVGSFTAWSVAEGSGTLFLQDKVVDGVNNNIFTGPWKLDADGQAVPASNVAAGSLSWRFYTELTGSWGSDGVLPSIGSGPNDFTSVAVDVPGEGSSVTLPAVPGKGNYDMAGWPGGDLTFILDMTVSPWELQIKAGSVDEVGDATGEPTSDDYVWFDNVDGWANIYCWAWNDDENCTASGNWPGDPLKQSSNGKWFWQVPAGKSMPTKIIFSNGSEQTEDLDYVNNGTYTPAGLK